MLSGSLITSPHVCAVYRRSNLDENLVALDHGLKGLEVYGHGYALGLAGLDVEAPGMKRTFDATVLDITFRQRGIGMGADVVGGVILAAEVEDGDMLIADNDFFGLVLGDIADLADKLLRKPCQLPPLNT
jgi:hypothetical protein